MIIPSAHHTPLGEARTMHTPRSARRALLLALFALAVLALGFGSAPAQAAGIPEDDCKMSGLNVSICAYVTNRVLQFGDQPGVLAGTGIEKSRVRVANGNHAEKGPRDVAYNDATYDSFSRAAFKLLGFMTFQGTAGPLSNAEVTVRADYDTFTDTDPDKRIGLTCEGASYFVCETSPVWMKNRTGDAAYNWVTGGPKLVSNVIGFASIESRPLIVKILNMTEQPLVRSGDVRTNGLLRSEEVADPATVAASVDDRTGVGYYHFYRDAERGNSATFLYEFADGTSSTSLTGGALEFTIDVAADGSTDASKCVPPTGILQNVECSVTVIGIADGTLQALVAVGV